MITKEDAQKLLKINNKSRAIIQPLIDFIEKKEERGKIKLLEKEVNKLGGEIYFKEASKKKVYSLGQILLLIMVAKEMFNWDNEVIKKLGKTWIKKAAIVKLLSYLFKVDKEFFFKKIPLIGQRVMLDMKVVPLEIDFKKKKIARLRIEGVKIKKDEKDPLIKKAERIAEIFYGSFFAGFVEIILGVEKVNFTVDHDKKGFVFTFHW